MSIRNGISALVGAMEKDLPREGTAIHGAINLALWVAALPLVLAAIAICLTYALQARVINAVVKGYTALVSSEQLRSVRLAHFDFMQTLEREQVNDFLAYCRTDSAVAYIWGVTTAVVVGGVLWVCL